MMQIPLIARSQILNADFPHRNLVDFLLQHPVVDVKAFWTSEHFALFSYVGLRRRTKIAYLVKMNCTNLVSPTFCLRSRFQGPFSRKQSRNLRHGAVYHANVKSFGSRPHLIIMRKLDTATSEIAPIILSSLHKVHLDERDMNSKKIVGKMFK